MVKDTVRLGIPPCEVHERFRQITNDFDHLVLNKLWKIVEKYEDSGNASLMTNDSTIESVANDTYATAVNEESSVTDAAKSKYSDGSGPRSIGPVTRLSKRSGGSKMATVASTADKCDPVTETKAKQTQARLLKNQQTVTKKTIERKESVLDKYVTPKSTFTKKQVSRVAAPSPNVTKTLTESALKKIKQQEAERAALLQQQLLEKEKKAQQQKEQFLLQKVESSKKKREEKERKVAKTREQLEKEALEKRLRESAKKKEADKRRIEMEEARKAMVKREEEKALAEKKAAEEAIRKAAEAEAARMREESERTQAELKSKIAQIQQKQQLLNSSQQLHQKALTNSFMQKQQQQQQPTKTASEKVVNSTYTELPAASIADVTFNVPKVVTEPESYDIGDLNSDSENEDDNSKKVIPKWATGKEFIDSLAAQYGISKKNRDRKIFKIFRMCPTQVDLEEIFAGYAKTVSTRYDKRTSSAVWASPPAAHLNLSQSFWNECSFSKSMFESK